MDEFQIAPFVLTIAPVFVPLGTTAQNNPNSGDQHTHEKLFSITPLTAVSQGKLAYFFFLLLTKCCPMYKLPFTYTSPFNCALSTYNSPFIDTFPKNNVLLINGSITFNDKS